MLRDPPLPPWDPAAEKTDATPGIIRKSFQLLRVLRLLRVNVQLREELFELALEMHREFQNACSSRSTCSIRLQPDEPVGKITATGSGQRPPGIPQQCWIPQQRVRSGILPAAHPPDVASPEETSPPCSCSGLSPDAG